jgi:predicted GTPase
MRGSIFENLSSIKDAIRRYAQEAEKNGWLTAEECQNTIRRVDEDRITIGVIGQMNAGKSTFLNALLFEKEVLPAASTPMTAALTEISYGEKPAVEAEFYTADEWEGIKRTAETPLEGLDERRKNEVGAAKELVTRSRSLGAQITGLLGEKKTASFDNLLDFVGAEGKYVALTKSAKIMYPLDMLKGVQIVDTPGFNDPVISREQRSVQFLARADVVILLLYSARAFDETDRNIIFEKVRNVGVGKIIIAVNKYDVDMGNENLEGGESVIQKSVKDTILKAVRERNDPVLQKLLGGINPILFSAYMALLAKKPMAEINASETAKYDYDRLCNKIFEVHTQDELYEKSHLDNLKAEIDDLLRKEKIDILVTKSLNSVRAKIDARRTEFDKTITQLGEELKILTLDPGELEEKQRDCERTRKRIGRTISGMKNDIQDFFDDKNRKIIGELNDLRINLARNIKQCVSAAKSGDEAGRKIDVLVQDFRTDCVDKFDKLRRLVKTELKTQAENTIAELDEIIVRFSDGDEEASKDYLLSCRAELQKFNDLSLEDIFASGSGEDSEEETSEADDFDLLSKILVGTGQVVNFVYNTATFGLWGKLINWLDWKNEKKELLNTSEDELVPEIDGDAVSAPVKALAEKFIGFFEDRFQSGLIDAISAQVEKAQAEFANREKRLKEVDNNLKKSHTEKTRFEEQVAEANRLVEDLV